MALGVSATMAFLLLFFSLVVVSHCDDLQADSATNASSSYRVVVPAKVHAVDDAEGLLRLPSSVAEPDPDRSQLDGDELATKKPCSEGQLGYEKVKEQMEGENKEEEEKEKANMKKEGKKKTKKHHDDGDDKGKKEKKAKKHHRQSDDEDKEEENTKKRIHGRHHHVEDESVKKKKKLSHHIKNKDNSDDYGRRSQREEA